MSMTLTLPGDLAALLRRAAAVWGRPPEEVALDILRAGLPDEVALDILRAGLPDEPAGDDRELDDDLDLDLDAVVAAIRALPRDPRSIRPGRGSLADFLAGKLTDEPFDLAAWEADWAAVEAEMVARERADDRAEGHA